MCGVKYFKSVFFIVLVVISTEILATSLSIGETITIDSKFMKENREFYIIKPKGYEANSQEKYPVFVLLDAEQNLMHAYSALKIMAKFNSSPGVILVGVPNKNRYKDLEAPVAFTEKYNKQMSKYISDEIVGYVNSNYRTNGFEIVSGHSMSANYLINDFLYSDKTYDAYLLFSPLFDKVSREDVSKKVKELKENVWFIMSHGLQERDFTYAYDELAQLFNNKSQSQSSVKFDYFTTDTSHEFNVQASQLISLQRLFGNWRPKETTINNGMESLNQHYKLLTEKYGFSVKPPIATTIFATYEIASNDDSKSWNKIPPLVRYSLLKSPSSKKTFEQMAQQLEKMGMKSFLILKEELSKY